MENALTNWEYMSVEALFVPDPQDPRQLSDRVMFFDHYTREYRGQRSDLDQFFAKLTAEGWKLTDELGPWPYDQPDQDAVRPLAPFPRMIDHLSWMHYAPGRKLYLFKRPHKR
jgi:hypothetical protein